MRKAWKRIGAWVLRMLGQQEIRLTLGVKTVFRGTRSELYAHDYQAIAAVFERVPVLEDYLRIQLDQAQDLLRGTSTDADGDRRRLVLQAQSEVLQDMLNLPHKAAAKAQALMQPKKFPKGLTHA